MQMDPNVISREIIPKLNTRHSANGPSVYFTISSSISKFHWQSGNLETLIEKLLDHVLKISDPGRRVRIAVHEKKRMVDLERFFSIFPRYWFHLCVESQASAGFEDEAKKIFKSFGYHCLEWIGVEGSTSQLGAFYYESEETPALVLFIQNRGARCNCDLLIPVKESVSCLAHAI
jgi:hypothetical protein